MMDKKSQDTMDNKLERWRADLESAIEREQEREVLLQWHLDRAAKFMIELLSLQRQEATVSRTVTSETG